ncbi:accessory Sec system protein Asp2 [Streptococcus oricebi]|uniref:Accessory Sec system protein Asp2 n=1 Tax=Streptococcus oricebi TaxID=1547447 RepID=A0ABS5B3D2_9STRE|nr:accessory Sec system protein Asp2 [Streptococcus oricebi]MBP2622968.1 accessory Sec system protein Asp2 [Streptococcus oricebi]
MAAKLNILQVGLSDWSREFSLPENMAWHFFWPGSSLAIKKVMQMYKIARFDAIILDDLNYLLDLQELEDQLTPYTIFYEEKQAAPSKEAAFFLKRFCAQAVDLSDPEEILRLLAKALFRGQYGDKLTPIDALVQPAFKGRICYNGYEDLELEGAYGEDFSPLVSWKYNIVANRFNPVELWLEYQKEASCQIQLRVKSIAEGSTATVVEERVFSEEEMEQALVLDHDFTSYLGISLEAKGQGRIRIGALHQRLTRYQFGKYVLGGQILKDSKRQEINYFFYPGDFKPPLAVYFSGYRRAEGFEGFGMMRSLGMPFLLFSDPRVDGGLFYLGSQELETGIKQVIQDHLDLLGFSEQELILSGISMGTYGAMYYGADFKPAGIVLSKPLANLGTIAERGRLLLPRVFPTAFDVLHRHTGGKGKKEVEELNQRFWQKFEAADFRQTTFALSYMKEEDYDPTAFQDLVQALEVKKARVVSKGTSGRHNDDDSSTISWFVNYYKMLLREKFGRKD